jgi:hypothetical protein
VTREQLLRLLFDDGRTHPLAATVEAYVVSSRRFAAFLTAFATKIRKKLRSARDHDSVRDLALELETAYLLLRERGFSLEYEPRRGGRVRGPDFAVAFTTSSEFLVEVTRLRSPGGMQPWLAAAAPSSKGASTSDPLQPWTGDRLVGAVSSKLGQLLPGAANLVIVGVEAMGERPEDLGAAMLRLQQRAERDDGSVLVRYGHRSRREFFRRYQRLSGVLVREAPYAGDDAPLLWMNPRARVPLTSKIRKGLEQSHAAEHAA